MAAEVVLVVAVAAAVAAAAEVVAAQLQIIELVGQLLQIAIIDQVTLQRLRHIPQHEPIELQPHIHILAKMLKQLITRRLIAIVQHNIQHFIVLNILQIIIKLEE